jgi:hypothetical protein
VAAGKSGEKITFARAGGAGKTATSATVAAERDAAFGRSENIKQSHHLRTMKLTVTCRFVVVKHD